MVEKIPIPIFKSKRNTLITIGVFLLITAILDVISSSISINNFDEPTKNDTVKNLIIVNLVFGLILLVMSISMIYYVSRSIWWI